MSADPWVRPNVKMHRHLYSVASASLRVRVNTSTYLSGLTLFLTTLNLMFSSRWSIQGLDEPRSHDCSLSGMNDKNNDQQRLKAIKRQRRVRVWFRAEQKELANGMLFAGKKTKGPHDRSEKELNRRALEGHHESGVGAIACVTGVALTTSGISTASLFGVTTIGTSTR